MTDCIYPEVKALQNISDISKVQALVEIFWKTIKFTDNSNLVSSSGSYHTLPNENTGNERFHQFIEWLIKKDFLGNDQLEIGLYRERIKIQLKEARQSASYDKTISLGRAINEYKKDREWFVEQAFNGQLGIFVVIDVGSLTYQPSKNRFCYTDIYGFKHYGKLIGERYFQSAFSEFSIKDLLQQSVNDAVVYDGIVLSDDKFIRLQPTEAENRLGFMPIFHKDWSQLTKIQDGRKVWDDEQFFFLKDEINGCLGGIRTTEEVDEPEEPPKTDSQYQRERAEKTPKRTQRKEYIELLIWFADQSSETFKTKKSFFEALVAKFSDVIDDDNTYIKYVSPCQACIYIFELSSSGDSLNPSPSTIKVYTAENNSFNDNATAHELTSESKPLYQTSLSLSTLERHYWPKVVEKSTSLSHLSPKQRNNG